MNEAKNGMILMGAVMIFVDPKHVTSTSLSDIPPDTGCQQLPGNKAELPATYSNLTETDCNGDGLTDVRTYNQAANTVHEYDSDLDGNFDWKITYEENMKNYSEQLDLNHDGFYDLSQARLENGHVARVYNDIMGNNVHLWDTNMDGMFDWKVRFDKDGGVTEYRDNGDDVFEETLRSNFH